MVLLGFTGNYAYLWDHSNSIQIFAVDTKGGNRPITLALRDVDERSYGKQFVMAYAFGDQLVVQNNWETKENQEEQSFALEESLHGREILAVTAIRTQLGKTLVFTGSEDTYVKVSELGEGKLVPLQTFSDHVASVRCLAKLRLVSNEHLVVSAGSRMEANVYKVILDQTSHKVVHLCHFMRSFEQREDE